MNCNLFYNSLFTVYNSLHVLGPNSYVEHWNFTETILPTPPPPHRTPPLNRIENRYDTIFSYGGSTIKGLGSNTQNLVKIFKGLVTLYAFCPFQFTIRHTTAPCLIEPVSYQTWWSPFTGRLLVVQGNGTPDLDQTFAQLLFKRDHFHSCPLVSLLKISYYNSTPPPSRSTQ